MEDVERAVLALAVFVAVEEVLTAAQEFTVPVDGTDRALGGGGIHGWAKEIRVSNGDAR